MRLQTFNKKTLFGAFFVTFLLVGIVPYGLVSRNVLRDVDNRLTSSLNNEYYLIAKQITLQIDQVNMLTWKSSLEQLSGVIADNSMDLIQRNSALDTFFRQSPDILAMVVEGDDAPLYFLKEQTIARLSAGDADGVGELFTASCDSDDKGLFRVCTPVSLHVDEVDEVFLPMELQISDQGRETLLRCVFQLSGVLEDIGQDARFGIENQGTEIYIVDANGAVLYASEDARFRVGGQLDYPIADNIIASLGTSTLARVSQLEQFDYQQVGHVGNYVAADSLNLAAVLVDNRDSAYALVRETRQRILLNVLVSFILCILFSVVFSWFFSRFIARAEDAWREARDAAESATRSKSNFLAVMSHELRTPMNGVIGMASLLLDTPLNREQRNFTTIIQDSGNSLVGLINNILDFSKIEANKMELEERPFALYASVEKTLTLMAPKAVEKGIELIVAIDPDLPYQIIGDSARLEQVLLNLVGNSLKFTDSGQIEVKVNALASDAMLEFQIQDSGIGIAPENIESLFQSFTQADSSTTRKYGGTGLGLNICVRLVQLMGGRIDVKSELGQGACFSFTMPLRAAADRPEPPLYLQETVGELADRSLLILLDNRILANALETVLCFYGVWVEIVNSNQLALLADNQAPELLLTDAETLAALDEQGRERLTTLLAGLIRRPALLTPLGYTLTDTLLPAEMTPVLLSKPVGMEALFHGLTKEESYVAAHQDGKPVSHAKPVCRTSQDAPRILIAEDNRTNQILALKFLARLGLEADVANNGAEALQAVTDTPYDIVFMDVNMPEIDGLEATERIRAELPEDRQPMIIAMTANVMKEDRRICRNAGMDDFVDKPFASVDFERVLAPWLDNDQSPALPAAEEPEEEAAAETDEQDVLVDMAKLAELRQVSDELAEPDDEMTMIDELFAAYHQQAPESVVRLVQLGEQGDYQAVIAEAHKLRGLCLNLGLNAMATLSEAIEHHAPEERDSLMDLIIQLQTSHVQTDTTLAVILKE